MAFRLWAGQRPPTREERQQIGFALAREELVGIDAWKRPIKLSQMLAGQHPQVFHHEREHALEWLADRGLEHGFAWCASAWGQHLFTVSNERALRTVLEAQGRCEKLQSLALKGITLDAGLLTHLVDTWGGRSLMLDDCRIDVSTDVGRWRDRLGRRHGRSCSGLAVIEGQRPTQGLLIQVAAILVGALPLHRLKLCVRHRDHEVGPLLAALASRGTVRVLEISLTDADGVLALLAGLVAHRGSIPLKTLKIHCLGACARQPEIASQVAEFIGGSTELRTLLLDLPIGTTGLAALLEVARARRGFILECPVRPRLRGDERQRHASLHRRLEALMAERV